MNLIAKKDSSRRRRCEMKDKVVLGGSIIAAIAASLCCLGPLVAVALGIGAFGAAAAFESIRPYLLGLTALLLAVAFYLTYRKREVRCEDGSCQVHSASRASKLMLWLATIAVIAFAAFPYYSGALFRIGSKGSSVVASDSNQARVIFKVSGMSCGSCAAHIHSALMKAAGIKSADVSYEKGEAVVIYDPAVTNPQAIKAAIDDAGYQATEDASSLPQTSRN
jgi:mercuric ion transport protein